jgi:acetyl esterase/lipase
MCKSLIFSLFILFPYRAIGQEFRLPLYSDSIPNTLPSTAMERTEYHDVVVIRDVHIPDIAVYLPSKRNATGQAVVICPGGGYWLLAYDLEGADIARYLNSIGVAAIVLKYRLPVTGNTRVPYMAPLQDAQRALRLVRFHAAEWGIQPKQIGIMGFSAGGHLASSLGTHFDYGLSSDDPVEQVSCRPDFMILMYPVISMSDSCRHIGSCEALLGRNATSAVKTFFSSELQVTHDTPPAFLVHATDDKEVAVENTLIMYNALRKHHIPAEMLILSEGGHGFGLGLLNEHVHLWTLVLRHWLKQLQP